MKTLFDKQAVNEIFDRMDRLTPSSQKQWGKMEVAQMFAHCSAAMEVATGKKFPPRIFIGRILGPMIKSSYYNDEHSKKNNPTDKSFIISDKRDFEKEKILLKEIILQFSYGGVEKCTKHPHSFFGKLTEEQWGKGMYKHLDHHLKQFGV